MLLLVLSTVATLAAATQTDAELPNFDKRLETNGQSATPAPDHRAAMAKLKASLPDVHGWISTNCSTHQNG